MRYIHILNMPVFWLNGRFSFLGAESSEIDSLLDRFSLDGLSSHNVGGTESDSGLVV